MSCIDSSRGGIFSPQTGSRVGAARISSGGRAEELLRYSRSRNALRTTATLDGDYPSRVIEGAGLLNRGALHAPVAKVAAKTS